MTAQGWTIDSKKDEGNKAMVTSWPQGKTDEGMGQAELLREASLDFALSSSLEKLIRRGLGRLRAKAMSRSRSRERKQKDMDAASPATSVLVPPSTAIAAGPGLELLGAATKKTGEVVSPKDFHLRCVIGQGAFGKVFQVMHTPTGEILAMKVVSKKVLSARKAVSNMQAERDIMTRVNHPFLIKLLYAFQTDKNVYLVMPFVSGGELFHHLHNEGLLLEDTARFYAAEMVLALEHLHDLGIIHRDLKPENILLDERGHIRLTDFGLAKEMSQEKDSTTTICGTHEYMAPEMIRGKAYDKSVDWWALGALIFEMVTGKPAFQDKNRKKLDAKILNERLILPKWLRSETHSIIKGLMDRNIDKRLGCGKSTMFEVRGVQAVKKHPFFKSIDWHALERREIQPPLVPVVKHLEDTSNFAEEFTKMDLKDDVEPNHENGEEINCAFERFSFVADENRQPPIENESNSIAVKA